MVKNKVKVTLVEPISLRLKNDDGEREEFISEVTVRKPKMKDLRGLSLKTLDAMDIDTIEKLTRRLCGLSELESGELGFEDVTAITKVISDFFPKSSEPDTTVSQTTSGD